MEATREYTGLLFIGDPHLEGRQPGFRKDEYPQVILEKLAWCLAYANEHRLLPAILGDLFDKPRDNPNWLIGRLLQLLQGEVLCLYGNHDVHYNPELTDDDSLSLLVKAGRLRLLSADDYWRGCMAGRPVVVGGSSYRQEIPARFDCGETDARPLVVWLTHHDISIPGYDEGRFAPRELTGIDLVVNGHIHRRLETVTVGSTHWLTPGNISRRSRSDACRSHIPAVLRLDVLPDNHRLSYIELPHRPFEEVFHACVVEAEATDAPSTFVAGLAELQARRTTSGAGLREFLDKNLNIFEPEVAAEIRTLALEVIDG
jgi:DNA repair exonuclease SbcCD nuclease subunit